MLDIRFIRENPDRVQEAATQKGYKVNIQELLSADEVFVTNALMDVMPVSLLEERHLDLGAYQVVPQLQGNGR